MPFVGRTDALARLAAVHRALTTAPGGSGVPGGTAARRAGLALVTGEPGIGKSTLLGRFADEVAAAGGRPVWGTCWDGERTPAYWPWTQALRSLLDHLPATRDLAADLGADLGAIVPELGGGAAGPDADRLRVFDAVGRLLSRAAAEAPVVVILDDLQWGDRSSVDLLRFVAAAPQPGPLLLVGAYRPGEADPEVRAGLATLATRAELVPLQGLSADEVAGLVADVAGAAAADRWTAVVHERTGGHPFYARELCRLLADGGAVNAVPPAVREVIDRRLAQLSDGCAALLEAAAVAGPQLLPDVLTDVLTDGRTDGLASGLERTDALIAEAATAGILTGGNPAADNPAGGNPAGGNPAGHGAAAGGAAHRFAHDLYRESVYTAVPHSRRVDLHHRVAGALLRRRERGSLVFPAELARHFAAAVPVAGPGPALAWARAAAAADTGRYAFAEGAGHLARVRSAVTAAGGRLPDPDLVDLLTAEADLRLRAGDAADARALLDWAGARADATGRADLAGTVALGLDRLGARFAMPRTDLVAVLERARARLEGSGTALEAAVTAALARQLQHSVPADRPRARPLAERAVAIARALSEPVTLASCLLAHHDTLWTPGTAAERAAIAQEISELAVRADDPERHAQALLLLASAQVEAGSAAFRATLAGYAYATERLRQPRHDYLLATRRAALALLDGDLDTGARLSAEAAALGEAVGDTDAGNVRMSQRLEVVRARGDAAELRETAAAAVRWWVGAPVHARAVAAGFFARAGDLEAARRELDTVLAIDDWRGDRSYLWSVFIGELTAAAIALDDRPLCERLLDDLLPVADSCAVNGAFVCFMGSHAHRVGLLHAALGRAAPARQSLAAALDVHRRLGARAWADETAAALAGLDGRAAPARGRPQTPARQADTDRQADTGGPRLRRVGELWEASFRGRSAYLRDAKGLRDLAALLDRPGADLPALELAGGGLVEAGTGPVADRAALAAYRRRLAELDDELAAAGADDDLARRHRATDERERLLAELRHATRPGGRSRALGAHAAERARKAVSARIREAIRRVAEVLPDLGRHLDRTVRTGTTCRYDPGP